MIGTQIVRVESYVPEPRQLEAHLCPARYPLYGGAMRGGKTAWLVNSGIQFSMKWPGNRGFICRHEGAEFRRSTMEELEKWLNPELLKGHNKSYQVYEFLNGSKMFYGGLGDDKKAIDRLKSMELGWFGIDQIEETSEAHFLLLTTRLTLTLPGIIYKGLCTANPAQNWVKSRWIDQALEDHAFIPAFPEDNPHNPKGYLDDMRKVLPPELLKAWMEGDWDAVSDENIVFPFVQVQAAMMKKLKADDIPVSAIGVDVARDGDDETVMAFKRGAKYSIRIIKHRDQQIDTMATADRVMEKMLVHTSSDVKIDAIGLGAGVYDRIKRKLPDLQAQGYKGNLYEYKASVAATKKFEGIRFKNRRAQDHYILAQDLEELDLPLDPVLRTQMTIRYRILTSDGLYRIESKEEFKKRVKNSPDRLDAIVIAHAPMRKPRKGRVLSRRR